MGGSESAFSMSGGGGGTPDPLRERLLEQRIVLVGGELDDGRVGDLVAQVLLLTAADPRAEIRVYLNSPGGASAPFLSLYDTVQTLSAPVATVCMSQAKGTAALLLAAGTRAKRLAFRHSTVLLKLPEERFAGGDLDRLEAHVSEARRRRRSLVDIAARHIEAKDRETLAADLERGLLLSSEEAKEYGIVDAVIDPDHPYFVRFPLPPQPGGNGG